MAEFGAGVDANSRFGGVEMGTVPCYEKMCL